VAASLFSKDAVAGITWRARVLDGGEVVWVSSPAGLDRVIERHVFGVDAAGATAQRHRDSTMAAAVTAVAMDELREILLKNLTGRLSLSTNFAGVNAPEADRQFRQGSGAVLITVGLDSKPLRLLLPTSTLPKVAPEKRASSPQPVTHLPVALSRTHVTLTAEVGEAELTLGHLRTLAIGDVIPLSSRIDQPLKIAGPGGTAVCRAHIGLVGDRRAVELVSLSK
jgi:flagellar motor switch/type III secretory pathway protein FliN